jgi:hypothetical protein
MRYSRAGIIPSRPAVTGIAPIEAAIVITSTFSRGEYGVHKYFEIGWKIIYPSNAEGKGIELFSPAWSKK